MNKLAVIFAGQGSQYEGMGSKLYDRYPEIRGIYDSLGKELTDISFSGNIEDISETNNLQPIMIAFQLAVLKLIRTHRPELLEGLEATCGLSLGEYSALSLSKIVSEDEALRLVSLRGELMEKASEKSNGKMLAILKMTEGEVREIVHGNPEFEGKIYIANINSGRQIIVSGEGEAIDNLKEFLKSRSKLAKSLAVSGAFHTPFMEQARAAFVKTLGETSFSSPEISYYPNVTGEKYDGTPMSEVLSEQIVSPVLLYKSFKEMVTDGITHFLEIGPGGVLSTILDREFEDIEVSAIKNDDDLIKLLEV
ncbi:ACP S-malonyltransferase [Mogibacterium pumilum]|uniref:Malonyl CoA-acyl carrier protein transacylase n=1 Tax=Mogibacterium pumilum TaxID=86332 RepID=A0A223ARZ6_9FIRM|nr:ACP S-malonyltransferase [Mogibacterium pumilum]ASS37743.1 acyl transferase [Mogibacterium pumilum]